MSEMSNISEHPENPQIFDEPPVTHAAGDSKNALHFRVPDNFIVAIERAQRAVRNLVISEHPENTH